VLLVIGPSPHVNPVGGAPAFLAMTTDRLPPVRAMLVRVAINAFVFLLASMLIGTYVLDFFGLSVPIVQVAEASRCARSIEPRQDSTTPHDQVSSVHASTAAARAFYPLTMPLTVGPGSISVAITLGANHPRTVAGVLVNGAADAIGTLVVAASVFLFYRYADRVQRALGESGTSVVVRLSAFILLCIGVQIVWNGMSSLLATLPSHGAR
jgi:multiple antibiotic resistance protein